MDPLRPDETRTEDGFAAAWSSDGVTRSLAPTGAGLPVDLPFLFSAGQRFGPYVVVRPIGKGGMGQVYEVEESDSGRRVAIKILSRGIGDDEERERFLQEGRLAASLSHPNTVYVFGTTEVQGFPVIAMELAPAGTLKDLVVPAPSGVEGPGSAMPPARAVDAVLQVIDGLDAAAAIGILHRDVKPSNCFVAADGRVLVGDFGLSIATLARADGSGELPGTILGTPGFASPEQLRGLALDVRSDIYSVGATLYYLLTGKPPFEDASISALIARVGTEAPPSLSAARPDVPSRLAGVVAKCLAKKPSDRHATYGALRSALEPFRSAAVAPAPLGRRFFAGAIDSYVASLLAVPLNLIIGAAAIDLTQPRMFVLAQVPAVLASIVYYAMLEGRFGCGAGKALFNLRVVDRGEMAPGIMRALVRALVFVLPGQIARLAMGALVAPLAKPGPAPDGVTQAMIGGGTVVIALLIDGAMFSTIRRRNGFAGLHDLASGTRVVVRPRSMEARQAAVRVIPAATEAFDGDRLGPYLVPRGSAYRARNAAVPLLVEGFDDRLRRPVWVELLPEGTPPLPPSRRDIGRPGRLRWLSGRRLGADCWDAYEAIPGVTLAAAVAQPQPWARVRHWLADLSMEAAAAIDDGSLPTLAADRVWIGADDRARLLDWTPPRPPGDAGPATARSLAAADLRSATRFIYGVAVAALKGDASLVAATDPPGLPLPLPGRAFLASLRAGAIATPGALATAAGDALRGPVTLSRSRRAVPILASAVIPVLLPIATIGAMRLQTSAQADDPKTAQFNACVGELATYAKRSEAKLTPEQRHRRDAIEIYIAEHLQDEAQEASAVARSFPVVSRAKGDHLLAERALARHPTRTAADVREADRVVAGLLELNARKAVSLTKPRVQWALAVYMAVWACAVVGCLALAGAFLLRGGFTARSAGAALVNARGDDASRFRALWRAVVAWLPAAAAFAAVALGPGAQKVGQTSLALLVLQTLLLFALASGAAWAIRHPSRSLQDRLSGTWIVPR